MGPMRGAFNWRCASGSETNHHTYPPLIIRRAGYLHSLEQGEAMKSNLAIVCQKYLGYLALLFALGGVWALPVGAQINTASLSGQVADANGGGARGGTGTAQNKAQNVAPTVGAGHAGNYHLRP